MRNIDSNILAELAKAEFRPFYLLDMEIESTHYRYTDCDVPIVFDGNTYTPLGFSIGSIKYSSQTIVDSLDLVIENLDSVMTSLFVGGTPQGSTVTLKVILIMEDGSIYYMPVSSICYTPVSTEGLVGYWAFDDGSGTVAVDGSGNGNDGTLVNMEDADWVDGVVGKALSFGGSDEYVSIPFAYNFTGYTFSFWQDADAGKMALGSSNSTFYKYGEASWHDVIDEWYHGASGYMTGRYFFTITWDGTTQKIYVNGIERDSRAHTGTCNFDATLYLGRYAAGYFYTGLIDEVRIYSTALTASEIKALYLYPAGNKSPIPASLDNLADGSTYGRVQIGALDGGYVDLLRMSADSTERLLVTAGGIEGYANNVKNFELASGEAYLGDQVNEHIKLSATGLEVKDGATVLATYGATVVIGEVGANLSNIEITAGALNLRTNEIDIISISNAGVASIDIGAGGDITMTPSDTDPALIKWSTVHNIGCGVTTLRGLGI